MIVERRFFFAVAAALLASSLPPGRAHASAQELRRSGLSFEEFLAEARPLSRSLMGDTSMAAQDRYLLSLAALVTQLSAVPVPGKRDGGQGETRGSFLGVNPGGEPFNVLHWRLDPGARIRPHAHTYGNVVTLGLDGEALLENFEVLGERSFRATGSVKVQRTRARTGAAPYPSRRTSRSSNSFESASRRPRVVRRCGSGSRSSMTWRTSCTVREARRATSPSARISMTYGGQGPSEIWRRFSGSTSRTARWRLEIGQNVSNCSML